MANSESGSSDDEDTAIPIITPEEVVVLPTENRFVAIKQISPVAIAPSTCLVPAPRLPMYKSIPTQFNLQITEELLRKNGILSGGQEPIQPGQEAAGTHQRKRESEQEEGGSEKQQKRESGQGGGPEEKPKNESGQEGGTSGHGNSSHNHYNYSGPLLIGGQLFHMNYEEVTTTTTKKCIIRR